MCLFFAFVLLLSVCPLYVFAIDTDSDYKEVLNIPLENVDLSETSIEYDFSHIYAGSFKVEDYKANATKNAIELISCMEIRNDSDNIELFIYVYNPAKKTIYNYESNTITFSNEEGYDEDLKNYSKYSLEIIDVYGATKNTSTETNATILKYKVEGFEWDTNTGSRVYRLVETEFNVGSSNPVNYKIAKTYKFTTCEDGMLVINVNDEETITLKANHTFYRVQTEKIGVYQDIESVYFAVDNELLNAYGSMNSIDVCWRELVTKPILIVDDEDIYDNLMYSEGSNIPWIYGSGYSFGGGINKGTWIAPGILSFAPSGWVPTTFKYGFNSDDIPYSYFGGVGDFLKNSVTQIATYFDNFYITPNENKVENEIEKLYFLFYLEQGEMVSFEEILDFADTYNYGVADGTYEEDCFSSISELKEYRFDVEQTANVNRYTINNSLWEYWGNFFRYSTELAKSREFYNLENFYLPHVDENKMSDVDLSERYLIDINDVPEFRKFVRNNADKSVFLLRYAIHETEIYEGALFDDDFIDWDSGINAIGHIQAKCYACNSTVATTTIIDDFDVLDINFGSNDGRLYTFPVGRAPTDFAPDLEHAEKPSLVVVGDITTDDIFETITTILRIAIIAVVIYLLIQLFVSLSPLLSNLKTGGKTNIVVNVDGEEKKNEKKNN
ncbi:MAG: hypothetical protein IJ437_04460 [Clostridia bacterium]|nr:hypothetical protein [Clostridia bacterium]